MSAYALSDLRSSFANFRLWGFISAKTLEVRYRRNVLGLFWLVVSFTVPALGIGYVLSRLQGLPLEEHIPHVLFGFVGWYYMNDCLVQGAGALTGNRGILLQAPMGRSVFALSMVLEKSIVLGVNLLCAVVAAIFFGWTPSVTLLFLPISLLVYWIAGLGTVMLMSIISARIRDISELVGAVMRLAFFFTPIIWSADSRSLGEGSFLAVIARYNPLTYFVDILRAPILGEWPSALTLTVTGVLTALVLLAGLFALHKAGRSIAFFV